MHIRRGAIIGFGNVAANGHLPGWLEHPDFEIVAVADATAERRTLAEAAIPGVRVYDSVGSLFDSERLDFVDIATPPFAHAATARHALSLGVAVLCEKPLVTRYQDLSEIFEAARSSSVPIHTVHNWKHSEAYQAAIRELPSLGSIRSVEMRTLRDGWSASPGDWRVERRYAGGGILVDHGWHCLYLLAGLVGAWPTEISAETDTRRYVGAEVEDSAELAIRFPHGARASISLTWAADHRETGWVIEGEHGSVAIKDDEMTVVHLGRSRTKHLEVGLSQGSHHPEWFPGVIAEFQAALNGAPDNRHEARQCMRCIAAAYESAQSGKVQYTKTPTPQPHDAGRRSEQPGSPK